MECGTQLPDNAKFCINCGANLQNVLARNEQEIIPIPKPRECHDIALSQEQFVIAGEKIIFNDDTVQNVIYRKLFIANAFNQMEELCVFYDENIKDFNSVYTLAIPESLSYIETSISMAIDILLEKNIFDYDVNSFTEKFGIADNFLKDIEPIIRKYDEIEQYSDQINQKRKIERAGRSRWEGGGFGLRGAIKGSIMAGVLNTGTGVFRGIGDSITDSRDSNKIYHMKQLAFQQGNFESIIANAVYIANIRIGYYLCCILQDNGILNTVVSLCEETLLKRKLDNLEKKLFSNSVSKEEAIEILTEWICDNPFSFLYYYFLFIVLKVNDMEISKICTYMGYDKEYEYRKVEYISQEIQRLSNDTIENINTVEFDELKQISMCCNLPQIERKKLENLEYELTRSEQTKNEITDFIESNSICESLVNELIEEGRDEDVWKMINSENAYIEWKLTDYYSKLVNPYVRRSDFKKIEQILHIAYEQAEQNHPYAMYLVNQVKRDCYVQMGNRDKTIRTDEKLLELSDQGQVSACAIIGFLYYQGDIYFKKNEKKAFELLQYAADKNQPMAMDWLGILYLEGIGTDKNIQKARKWLELAAYYGREHAKTVLDKM